ncbi:MAG: hypothetical protein ABJA82_15845 [Myxococcales bacterium]
MRNCPSYFAPLHYPSRHRFWAANNMSTIDGSYSNYSGSGIQGELSGGYEFLRASTIRMFVQADATLPLYKARTNLYLSTDTSQDSAYAPSFAVSFGVGWGHSITRIHVVN